MKDKVEITTGHICPDGSFLCFGRYDAFPYNPAIEGWEKDFKVNFNNRWYTVRVVLHDESWGWKAREVSALQAEVVAHPIPSASTLQP